ncbi:MAG: hypothetical protein KDB11_18380 [Planctomycetales bacterium]|nr:hypothetical protein [Planctomycetales bacterium]
MMILLGSSLMMVTRGWDELDAAWQYLVIIAYTGTIFGAGYWSYHKLGLRKTGTGLLALSTLLIPLSFVAWYWIWDASDSATSGGMAAGLLLLNVGVAAVASWKIFAHFLQGHQLTFVASYLALSVAGAIAPCIRETSEPWTWLASLTLWAVFTVGAVKVNRHVFWLTEEQRKPRIFGFFPVLLLGSQFLLVFGLNFAGSIPSDWFGLACALVAIPVLLTADAVAYVFQQRTGDLVRPIPWPIMLPIVVGVMLCATGVALAGAGLLNGVPYAVVPTAALAAILMALVARRTGHAAFVWAMLGCMTLAYNFSPVFFQELVIAARDRGASALNESKLPYAFYGLTYLPLILVSVSAAVQLERRKVELFAKPMRLFCAGISLLLLAVSVTHAKALFPVASAMTLLIAWQANAFHARRLAGASMIAFMIASIGATSFANGVLSLGLGSEIRFLCPTIAATLLLLAGPRLNAWIDHLSNVGSVPTRSVPASQIPGTISLIATLGLAVVWIAQQGMPNQQVSFGPNLLIFGLLAAHSLVWLRPAVSWVVYGWSACELLRLGVESRLEFDQLASIAILILGAQWFVSYLLDRYPDRRIRQAWSSVIHTSAVAGLLFATLSFAVPDMFCELLWDSHESTELLFWVRDILLVAWCFDAARRPRVATNGADNDFRWERFAQPLPAFLGCLCVLGFVGCGLLRLGGRDAAEWLPVAWSLTAASAIPLVQNSRQRLLRLAVTDAEPSRYFALRAVTLPVDITMCVIFTLFSALQLFFYTPALVAAGYVGLAGLLALSFLRRKLAVSNMTAVVLNWTLILGVVRIGVIGEDHLLELLDRYETSSLWFVSLLSAFSLLAWQKVSDAKHVHADIALAQRVALRLMCVGALLLTLCEPSVSMAQVVATLLTISILFAGELRAALRTQDASRVWAAEAIVMAGVGYFLWFDMLSIEHTVALFVPLGLGCAAYAGGVLAVRRDETSVLAPPLLASGRWLPLATVGVGVVRHLATLEEAGWLGINSLAILLAGGFYFWQAIERRSKGFAVLSAAILNIAIVLLWNEIGLSDPQFYMIPIGISALALVEILKREIPVVWHNPLRYAGALTILVSPTFHIVDKSWLHLIALMVLATVVLLVSIGLRLRALMYTGLAFLIADLVAMVICGGIDHPDLLWIAGIGFGAAIITLGAICENNREKLLQRMRIVSAQMEQWR